MIMKKLFVVALCAMALSVSCIRIVTNNVVASGQVTTQEIRFDAAGVEALGLKAGFDVVLDCSVEPGVVLVTTYDNIFEFVEVEVENGSLEIGMKSNNAYSVDVLEARLSPEGFKTFAVSGGANLSSVEPLNVGNDVIFAVSGGADVDLSLSCLNLVLAVSGGADVDLNELSANDINLAVSGGADVEMRGACNALEVEVSGGADVELGGLCAKSVVANASGGADLEVFATDSYKLDASGAADVEYHDTGAKVDADSSSAADISVAR
jgi:hypothetical protein